MTGADRAAQEWLDAHVPEARRREIAANLASWEAATSGSPEAISRAAEARAAVRRLYADAEEQCRVRELLRLPDLRDEALRRQLTLVDLAFTGNRMGEETIDDLSRREGELEEIFYRFRPEFEGAEVSNNALLEVLRTESDGRRRRAAWEASKRAAREVAEPLRELVRRRNRSARALGFADYYSMELALQEIDPDALFSLLDDFRVSSEQAFRELRREMDARLARKFGVDEGELYPWHWEDFFSQEAPSVGAPDLDQVFDGRDLVQLARDYFDGIGLPVGDVLERSDLFEREHKDQHAFCTSIDREGDVRILCNLRSNERWMTTLLHELGHAAYDKFVPGSLPYLLRCPAHTLTTEAVAMLMGRLTRTPEWLREHTQADVDPSTAEQLRAQLRASQLVAARWILVMVYFERELYRNPDREDLNSLWWALVEDLQRVRRPPGRDEPDWAAKMHLSLAPVYYHNYLLGEMTASQLGAAIRRAAPAEASGAGGPHVGAFLRDRLFVHGALLPWNRLMVHATGEALTSRYFVAEFMEAPPRT